MKQGSGAGRRLARAADVDPVVSLEPSASSWRPGSPARSRSRWRSGNGLPPGSSLKGTHAHLARHQQIATAASGPSGEPRSPTCDGCGNGPNLKHALHVRVVSGQDSVGRRRALPRRTRRPVGLTHVAVIQLCPWTSNSPGQSGSDAIPSLRPTEGLTEVERYAEVFVARTEYFLDSPVPLAQVVAAQRTIDAFWARARSRAPAPGGRAASRKPGHVPRDRASPGSRRAHGLIEGDRPSKRHGAGSKAEVGIAASTARVPDPLYFDRPANRSPEGEGPAAQECSDETKCRLGPYEVVGRLGSRGGSTRP
jgi:hypothetical protein